ncbi:uncharacterized protein LOC128999165 [Macrosteles quadrilineatus]|uniref:uncharacterized protein LOC128999165 n=1 Tax=Macrosteles quadrilineatus TaxID=74068 RepID=UPI0023E1D8E5|nr:uncharacterized protein LOC128999165 [Macrosteles quadrilineatus]
MGVFLKFIKCAFITLFLVTIFTEEVEARRKILKGRKTITREYYKPSLLPSWANVLLLGVGFLIVGVILYIALAKFILGSTTGIFMMDNEV